MGVNLGRKTRKAAARGTGGGKGQRKSPDAQRAAAQEILAEEAAFPQQLIGQPGQTEYHQDIDEKGVERRIPLTHASSPSPRSSSAI